MSIISQKKNKGFTLIESVIAIGLGLIAVSMIISFIIPSLRHLAEIKRRETLHSNALFLLSTFNFWIRQGERVEIPDSSTVEVRLPDSSVKTIERKKDEEEKFNVYLNDKILNTKEVEIENLKFTQAPASIKVDLDLKGEDGTSYSFSTTIANRNNR